jgi:RNA polymerase sigma-70 factor (ECF subfamily)
MIENDGDGFPLSDEELVQRLKEGDKEAFSAVYRRYASVLYHSAYHLLRDKTICDDLLQDLFTNLWIKRSQLRIDHLRAYLFRCMRNQVLMHVRSHKIHLDIDTLELQQQAPAADSALLEKEVHNNLRATMAELPDKCREVFYLSRKQQLSNKEIAQLLQISPKTVENQLTIALKRLKGKLGELLLLAILLRTFL